MTTDEIDNTADTINYYGTDANYIHVKFGHAWKMWNFTDEFRAAHPKFVEEYYKYCDNDSTSKFKSGLEIVNYVDRFNIPVHFYSNFTDTPLSIEEAKDYFVREALPDHPYQFVNGKLIGWDGEESE